MNKMNIEKIKQRIQKFSDDRNWDEFHNPKYPIETSQSGSKKYSKSRENR